MMKDIIVVVADSDYDRIVSGEKCQLYLTNGDKSDLLLSRGNIYRLAIGEDEDARLNPESYIPFAGNEENLKTLLIEQLCTQPHNKGGRLAILRMTLIDTLNLDKRDWIMLALREASLDRIDIARVLFLVKEKIGREIKDYFKFTPFFFQPFSIQIYPTLKELELDRKIIQPPHPKWVRYYLTKKGKQEAEKIFKETPLEVRKIIKEAVNEVIKSVLHAPLKRLSTEVPESMDELRLKDIKIRGDTK